MNGLIQSKDSFIGQPITNTPQLNYPLYKKLWNKFNITQDEYTRTKRYFNIYRYEGLNDFADDDEDFSQETFTTKKCLKKKRNRYTCMKQTLKEIQCH